MGKFVKQRRVEFADTDAAGIAHFASFFRYMEETEHDMLRSVGLGVLNHDADGIQISLPRVSVSCDYQSPARFEDLLEITFWVDKLGTSSVTYACEFHLEGRPIATGQMIAVSCTMADGEHHPVAVPMPPRFRYGLSQFRFAGTKEQSDG